MNEKSTLTNPAVKLVHINLDFFVHFFKRVYLYLFLSQLRYTGVSTITCSSLASETWRGIRISVS